MNAVLKKSHCDATKDTDEVRDENVEVAGPMMKAGEVLEEEMGATEDTTENGEDKVEAASSMSKAEEVIDKEIVTADHSDATNTCQTDW
jgi:hypothetical protein